MRWSILEHCPKYQWIPSLALPLAKAVVLPEVPEEQRAIEGVQVDDSTRYPVDDLCKRTACELHKPFGNITVRV